MWVLTACGTPKQDSPPTPVATAPLPTAGLAGQRVGLLPLTLVAAEDSLRWDDLVSDRRAALGRADSVLAALLPARAPEVTWVLPDELRRAARRAAGVAADPDQLGTAILRASGIVDVPDPLRSQLRTLAALAGSRFALVPAALVYRQGLGSRGSGLGVRGSGVARAPSAEPRAPAATAELSVVLVDVRLGKVGWRTVARGEGDDPWTALTSAVKALTPGLP